MDQQIFVRTLAGKTLTVQVTPDATIQDVKEKISHSENIPTKDQRLVYAGKQLDDARSLNDYCIGNDATLHLLMRLQGGQ